MRGPDSHVSVRVIESPDGYLYLRIETDDLDVPRRTGLRPDEYRAYISGRIVEGSR